MISPTIRHRQHQHVGTPFVQAKFPQQNKGSARVETPDFPMLTLRNRANPTNLQRQWSEAKPKRRAPRTETPRVGIAWHNNTYYRFYQYHMICYNTILYYTILYYTVLWHTIGIAGLEVDLVELHDFDPPAHDELLPHIYIYIYTQLSLLLLLLSLSLLL